MLCFVAQTICSHHRFEGNLPSQSEVAWRCPWVTNHKIPLFLRFGWVQLPEMKFEIQQQISTEIKMHLLYCRCLWSITSTNFWTTLAVLLTCQSVGVHVAWLTNKRRVREKGWSLEGALCSFDSAIASICKKTMTRTCSFLLLHFPLHLHPVRLNGSSH